MAIDDFSINQVNSEVNRIDSLGISSVDDWLPAQFVEPGADLTVLPSADILADPDAGDFVHRSLELIGISVADIAAYPELDAVTDGLAKLYLLQIREEEGE